MNQPARRRAQAGGGVWQRRDGILVWLMMGIDGRPAR
jgi:hypothetical protein